MKDSTIDKLDKWSDYLLYGFIGVLLLVFAVSEALSDHSSTDSTRTTSSPVTMARSGCSALKDAIDSGTGDTDVQIKRLTIYADAGCE